METASSLSCGVGTLSAGLERSPRNTQARLTAVTYTAVARYRRSGSGQRIVVRSPIFSSGYVICPSIYGIFRAPDMTPSSRDDTMPEPTSKRETGRPRVPDPTGGPLSPLTATQRGEASTQSARANPGERRNLASRQFLLRRIAMEYDEMPGLCLTGAAGATPVWDARRHLREYSTHSWMPRFFDGMSAGSIRGTVAGRGNRRLSRKWPHTRPVVAACNTRDSGPKEGAGSDPTLLRRRLGR